ncbi:hypothetical protein HYU19_04975 [Candidatus Woesearchaeota archaeon]|nr:hypothetical protein [Candidatus Woesearchaeota archaeon]
MNTTRIINEISIDEFITKLSGYKKGVVISRHALDRLADTQRNLFKEEELRKILLNETPHKVGIQKNGRYASFYRRKEGYLRIIFSFKETRIEIITFINTNYLPSFERLKNGD